jgi:hypothetical protein
MSRTVSASPKPTGNLLLAWFSLVVRPSSSSLSFINKMPGHDPHIKRRLTETRRRAHAPAVAAGHAIRAVTPPVGDTATIRSVTINRTGFRAWFIGIFLLSLFGLVGFEASEPWTTNTAGINDYRALAINATVNRESS